MNILCNCLDLHALGNEKNAELGQLQVIYNCFCNRISFHFNIIAVNRTILKMMRFQSRPTNWPLLTIKSPVAQVVRASD